MSSPALTNYLGENELSWKQCIGICTDGALCMIGSITGFVPLAKKENPDVIKTHYFLHCKVLVGKTLGSELKKMLDKVVKMINYIKNKLFKSCLFAKLCQDMEAILWKSYVTSTIPVKSIRKRLFF